MEMNKLYKFKKGEQVPDWIFTPYALCLNKNVFGVDVIIQPKEYAVLVYAVLEKETDYIFSIKNSYQSCHRININTDEIFYKIKEGEL